MAWTAPRTWVTGELVTAAMMNTHVRDNLDYLKTEADLIPNCTHAEVTGSRALDTDYQYTGGGFRYVLVVVEDTGTSHWHFHFKLGSATPTTIWVDEDDGDTDYNVDIGHVSGFVPNNWYYQAYEGVGGNFSLSEWHEWDLHD